MTQTNVNALLIADSGGAVHSITISPAGTPQPTSYGAGAAQAPVLVADGGALAYNIVSDSSGVLSTTPAVLVAGLPNHIQVGDWQLRVHADGSIYYVSGYGASWTPDALTASWNVTDQQLLYAAEYALLENAGVAADGVFATSMFTVAQFISALGDRQRQFLLDTGAIVARATQPVTAQISRYLLPDDWTATRRATFQLVGGRIYALFRTDAWQTDHALLDWEQSYDTPMAFHESTIPVGTLEIIKSPSDAGTLGILYVPLGAALTGAGVQMAVPPEFVWAIYYGALADLLSSDGEGHDVQRAQYCESRYQQGVELARLLLGSATATGGGQ